MTPLLQRIVRELTLPIKDRTFEDGCGLLSKLDDVHSFEVSEVWPLICDLGSDICDRALATNHLDLMEVQTFLPAPKTWIERVDEGGEREGWLIVQHPLRTHADVYCAGSNAEDFFSFEFTGGLWLQPSTTDLQHPGWRTVLPDVTNEHLPFAAWGQTFMTYAALALINTPRVIGRRQHMPHRGLEKAINRSLGVGSFPLRAWTELKLSVSTRPAGDEEHEAHLTGKKCLHFCRAHLRIRNGRLEMVKSHWRGDPALGIKRTRYRVTV